MYYVLVRTHSYHVVYYSSLINQLGIHIVLSYYIVHTYVPTRTITLYSYSYSYTYDARILDYSYYTSMYYEYLRMYDKLTYHCNLQEWMFNIWHHQVQPLAVPSTLPPKGEKNANVDDVPAGYVLANTNTNTNITYDVGTYEYNTYVPNSRYE